MKQEFTEYLRKIGIKGTLEKRIIQMCEIMYELYPGDSEEIDGIFIEDYQDESGQRVYEHLLLFSNYFAIERSNIFEDESLIGIYRLELPLITVKLAKEHYNLKRTTKNSSLSIEYIYSAGADGKYSGVRLRGSKENCKYLMQIHEKYFVPRFALKF